MSQCGSRAAEEAAIGDTALLLKVLVLLGIANGAPIIATRLLGARLAMPLDCGLKLPDGRALFGPAKTLRGIAVSLGCTALAAPLLGVEWEVGLGLAAGSMLGDLISSFIKRRLRLPPHAQAFGLDQVPEALLPLVLLNERLNLGIADIVALVAAFLVLGLGLSRLLFRWKIRDRPY